MQKRALTVLCALAAMAASVDAQAITGNILIKKRLSKPSVTAPVSVYQRGITVKLGKDVEEDPIAYERSRVVVYLDGPGDTTETTGTPPQMEQLDRRFVPDQVVVPVGSAVLFPNMDPIFHNVYSLSKVKAFDLGSYDKGETRKVVFPKPGIVEVYCHLHPNMMATVVVTPNRWYARPDRSGQYRIPDVPPGEYTLVAWHKNAGFFRKKVKIEQGLDTSVDFFIPLDVYPQRETQKSGEMTVGAVSR